MLVHVSCQRVRWVELSGKQERSIAHKIRDYNYLLLMLCVSVLYIGSLVSDFIQGSMDGQTYLKDVAKESALYNGFNLITMEFR